MLKRVCIHEVQNEELVVNLLEQQFKIPADIYYLNCSVEEKVNNVNISK